MRQLLQKGGVQCAMRTRVRIRIRNPLSMLLYRGKKTIKIVVSFKKVKYFKKQILTLYESLKYFLKLVMIIILVFLNGSSTWTYYRIHILLQIFEVKDSNFVQKLKILF